VRRSPHPITAYVSDYGSSTVTPISTRTSTAGKPIKVGRYPGAIAITPDGKIAYVVNSSANTVTSICTATKQEGKPIMTGKEPADIAITP
jgi:YVTN family beta-propeller protein